MSPRPTVYRGPVVHPRSLSFYEVIPDGVVVVSPTGDISQVITRPDDVVAFIVGPGADQQLFDVVELEYGEFLMPGFVDTHTASLNRFVSLHLQDGRLIVL